MLCLAALFSLCLISLGLFWYNWISYTLNKDNLPSRMSDYHHTIDISMCPTAVMNADIDGVIDSSMCPTAVMNADIDGVIDSSMCVFTTC